MYIDKYLYISIYIELSIIYREIKDIKDIRDIKNIKDIKLY